MKEYLVLLHLSNYTPSSFNDFFPLYGIWKSICQEKIYIVLHVQNICLILSHMQVKRSDTVKSASVVFIWIIIHTFTFVERVRYKESFLGFVVRKKKLRFVSCRLNVNLCYWRIEHVGIWNRKCNRIVCVLFVYSCPIFEFSIHNISNCQILLFLSSTVSQLIIA